MLVVIVIMPIFMVVTLIFIVIMHMCSLSLYSCPFSLCLHSHFHYFGRIFIALQIFSFFRTHSARFNASTHAHTTHTTHTTPKSGAAITRNPLGHGRATWPHLWPTRANDNAASTVLRVCKMCAMFMWTLHAHITLTTHSRHTQYTHYTLTTHSLHTHYAYNAHTTHSLHTHYTHHKNAIHTPHVHDTRTTHTMNTLDTHYTHTTHSRHAH